MSNEPSEMFMRIIVGSSTYGGIDCQCGKYHLCCDEDLNPNPEEIQPFLENKKLETGEWVAHAFPIGMADINGQTFVEGCDCNGKIAKLEKWIDSHEYIILEYFTQKQTAIQEEASRLKKALLHVRLVTDEPPENKE